MSLEDDDGCVTKQLDGNKYQEMVEIGFLRLLWSRLIDQPVTVVLQIFLSNGISVKWFILIYYNFLVSHFWMAGQSVTEQEEGGVDRADSHELHNVT